MCGICGTIRFAGPAVERERIVRAAEAMRHRGPDHSGTWISQPDRLSVGLGAVRLAVLDPTPAGHQPFHDSSARAHLIFNGEIYNYRELRSELAAAGDTFTTEGDTEVVLKACARWDTDALDRFNGMWALLFYDSHLGKGFVARDRFGIKPLLYAANEGALHVASELGALSELGEWDRTICPVALKNHLQFGFIAHPETIHQGARRLAPAHFMRFDAGGVASPERYYDLATAAVGEDQPDYSTECPRIRRLLQEAVVRRRVSDVPIGAFLSGGLDSSIIVAHLAAATGRPVKTFSVGHADHGSYDESSFARLVADHFSTEHYELRLGRRDVIDAIPRVLDHLGEPVGDSSIIPTALLSRFAAEHVTVALSGDGGDELFGGYWRYLAHEALASYRRVPAPVRRWCIEPVMARVGSSKSSGLANRVRQFAKLIRADSDDALARHVAWSRILAPEAEGIFTDVDAAAAADEAVLDRAKNLTREAADGDPLNRIFHFDLQNSLPGDMLQKVDLASMMHSLEVRVPFLDPQLVSRAMALPANFKVLRGVRKRILIDAYRGHLPDAVLDRGKMGFEVPFGEYLRGPLLEMFEDTVTRPIVESFGLLSYDGVRAVLDAHLQRRGEHADVLFALLSLCWWARRQGRSA